MPEHQNHCDAFSGGCQCGAVRYSVAAGPVKSSICHCRMCQRATGNAFAPLIEVKKERFSFSGEIRHFASSNLAERGFCPRCGTPIYFRFINRDSVELMAGTFDEGTSFNPTVNHGVESKVGWLDKIETLEDHETFFTHGEKLTSFQMGGV